MFIQNHKTKLALVLFLAFFLLTGQGCLIKFKKKEAPQTFDGGIYKSLDEGETWQQTNDVLSTKGGVRINTVSVKDFVFDSQNPSVIYLLTENSGLYLSLDSAKTWFEVKSIAGTPADIAIDPKNVCTTYAVVGNKVWKSTDCLRIFREVFHTDPVSKRFETVGVDLKDSNIIYALTSGEMYKSLDAGRSWQTGSAPGSNIVDLRMRQVGGTPVMFVLTTDNIYRTTDSGKEWKELIPSLSKRAKPQPIVGFAYDDSGPNSLLYITARGIFRSSDGGDNWQDLNVLSSPSPIYAAVIDPRNKDRVYYITATTFYRSEDGGKNWITKNSPLGRRLAKKFIIDTLNPKTMYLGTYQIVTEDTKKK